MKFDVIDGNHTFWLCQRGSEFLFWIGDKDITVKKKGFDGNVVDQKTFQYGRMQNVLIGGMNNRKGDFYSKTNCCDSNDNQKRESKEQTKIMERDEVVRFFRHVSLMFIF